MSYLLLDDGFMENRKIASISPSALAVHLSGLCYCARHLTDGDLDARALKVVQAIADVTSFSKRVSELVTAGLWIDTGDGGFTIHDYLEHNLSARQVKAKREAARKAARTRWGDASGNAERTAPGNAPGIAEGSAKGNALPSHVLDFGVSSVSAHLATSGKNGHGNERNEPIELPYFARLHEACGGTDDAIAKLRRAAKGKPQARIVLAYEACTGPGVRDPLAVALATLAKKDEPAPIEAPPSDDIDWDAK